MYSFPTLRLLADLLTQLAAGSASNPEDISRRADEMRAMVSKYGQGFPEHHGTGQVLSTDVVLVTGTTGALGSHIIAHLLSSPEISKVYALNRPGSNIQERQCTSFSANGLDVQLLESPKLKLLQGDLNAPGFGLSADDFNAIRDSVTSIFHNGIIVTGIIDSD